jgi:hypothetical protein
MTIDDFAKKLIEGYMLSDLETMSRCGSLPGSSDGAVGYPMMTTILSGMELLGGLLLPPNGSLNIVDGEKNFINFWENFYACSFPKNIGLSRLIYQLVRNGIAHTFIAKHGVIIFKFSGDSLRVDAAKREVWIDPNAMYEEFSITYKNLVKPILRGVPSSNGLTKEVMQKRLNQIDHKYDRDSKRLFDELVASPKKDISKSIIEHSLKKSRASSGASLSMANIKDIPLISTKTTTAPFESSSLEDDDDII